MSDEAKARAVLEAVVPLLDLFGTCDDVFTEDDALGAEKRRVTLGRVYEAWKRARRQLDPDWDPDARPRRRIGHPTVFNQPNQAQIDNMTG